MIAFRRSKVMDSKTHWSGVYQAKAVTDVSWYQDYPALSIEFIQRAAPDPAARIIDAGAGASTLADHLLDAGYRDLTLIDLSGDALDVVRQRLGDRSASISFIEADVTSPPLPAHGYDVWHDRAVFHFLVDEHARRHYADAVRRVLKPGGHAIVATFGPDGPTQCSGLPVARYDTQALHAALGDGFELLDSATEIHRTPWGSEQQFTYILCRMEN
jgi:SAM-dependent methyltransferase